MTPVVVDLERLDDEEEEDDDDKSLNIELRLTDSTGASSIESTSAPIDSDIEQHTGDYDSIALQEGQQEQEATTAYTPAQNALVVKLMSMRRQRRKLSARQRIAAAIGTIPVVICSLEMIPDRCHVCRENMELDAYFFTAAICGGFAAVIYGDSLDYWMPRLLGGSISALGSLFTNWMLLTSIPANLAFLFVFVGILGAMPGVVIYFLLKVISDECFESDLDDYDEIAPLTKIRITSAD